MAVSKARCTVTSRFHSFLSAKAVLAAVVLFALFVLTVLLGNWQLRRADEKVVLALQRESALALPAVQLGGSAGDAQALDGRRVAVRGTFEADRSIFLDNRTHQGRAGFHVFTPIRIDGSAERVVVLRGWLERDPRGVNIVPAMVTPTGVVVVEGFAQAKLPQTLMLGREKIPGPADQIWQSFNLERFRTWSGVQIYPLVLRQYSNLDDRLIREWPIVGSGIDKHRGYAVQWYLMATTIVVIAAVLLLRQWRSARI